jgi:O6-methylguanine-DNA--protein-cysteine methyltransferase
LRIELNAPFQNRLSSRIAAGRPKTTAAVLFSAPGLSTWRQIAGGQLFPKSSEDKIKENWAAYVLGQLSSPGKVGSEYDLTEELSQLKGEFYDLRSVMESLRREFVRFSESINKLNKMLDDRLLHQEQELQETRQKLQQIEDNISHEKVVVLRPIPIEQAKEEIRKLFSQGRTLYYSDIAEELGLDLETVVQICQELKEKQEVEVVADRAL